MPGKRARRHFSQLSEFERGLIIGMKTSGWSTRRAADQVDRSECAVRNSWEQWTREARVAQDFLRHFQTLPWPARSPDLSPVEHVWDQLKRQMLPCPSVHDLELAVQDLWAHLPQDNIRCLINSMPDRVVACIAAGGASTRY
ncbi:uncharacterized protein TNCV_545841 [Trichonephila clavipes]|nr:uncharacterized protein TNCV_545841 [Trichonephila clavipes]